MPCTGTTKCHEGECLDTAGCDNCSKLNGCCQNNTCVPGTSSAGCGQGGSPCDVCEQGEVCVDGACVRSTVACDYKTCPNGCCAADGCKQPFSDQSCGIGGLGCRACGPWEFCVAGYCQPKAVGCALSCVYGCCYGDQCLPFAQQTALLCGNNGQACRSCDQVRGEVCDIGQGLCNIQSSGTCPNCTGIDQCCNERNVCVNGESNLQCGSNGAKCQNCSLAPFGAGFSCHSQIGMGTNKCDDGSGGTTTICVESVRVNCKAGTSGASAICQQDLGEGPPLGFEVHIKVGLLTRNTNSAAASWDQQGSGIALATYANQCPHGGLSASDLADPITISVYETDPDAFNADDLVVGSCVVPQADLQSGLSSGRAEISCTTVDGGSCTVTLLFR